MTGVVQYVALDVPHCTLTYSVLPCRAQSGFEVAGGAPTNGSEPNAVGFGNDTYAVRSGGLTGAADGKQITGSFWYFADDNVGGNQTLFAGETAAGGATTRFRIRLVSGIFRITASTSGGTSTLDMRNTSALQVGSWYHVLFSFDLTSTSLRHLYIDDVSSLNAVTYANNNIDLTLADWSFGRLADGSEPIDGGSRYADFWLRFSYVDFSNATNRRKFISANGNPVYLGTIGQAPGFGTPIVYFGNGGTDFHTNLGTGGGFVTIDDGTQYGADFATGSRKCFNSLGTCQDLENFTEETVTLLFSENVSRQFATSGLTTFPLIKSVDYQPAIVSLEGEIGQRASLKVVFRDAPHSDTPASIFDKYLSSRPYNPYEQGTFFGKFRARNPYMRGRNIVLYIGEAGQPLESLEKRYFIIDSMDGPTPEGEFTITAQDILKLASGDRVVIPSPSSGFLNADIPTGTGTITIAPPGALADPNNFYGTDGLATFGGNEIVHYTNIVGDNVDIDARGIATEEQTHDAQDRFQHCYEVGASDPADVLYFLLNDVAGIDGAWLPIDDWHAESATYLGINISMIITEPTEVDKLLTEILQATGSALWWDDVNQQVRWQVIRSIPTTADRFTEDNVLTGTLEVEEQPEKRVSQVIVYYGQINPTIKVDEERNYRSTETVTDELTEFLEGSSAIKKIYAREIAQGGRAVANRIASRYLNRFKRAPRRFKFELLRFSVAQPSLGGGYLLGGPNVLRRSWPFQDDTGDWVDIPIQLTRVSSAPDRWIVEAEEMLASAQDDTIDTTQRYVFLDSNANGVNLKTLHDLLFREAVDGDTVNCIINSGILIGANNVGDVAFDVGGGWNSGVTINITNGGTIQGCGGNGGSAAATSGPTNAGNPGATALYTRQNINLENNGQIWGGGGGGGGMFLLGGGGTSISAGGGGGSGTNAGAGGNATNATSPSPGNNGSQTAGGAGGRAADPNNHGGTGGGPGQAGNAATCTSFPSQARAGGAGGPAVDGNSFITYTATGDRQGSLIN